MYVLRQSLILSAALLAAPPPQLHAEATSFDVTSTCDGEPFRYRMELRAKRSGYHVYRLTYPSPVTTDFEPNNTVPADYYLPDGIRPDGPRRPAVICMHILDGDFELAEVICSYLASRGMAALMFKLPYYGERGPPEGPEMLAGDPGLFAEAVTQAMADVRRTVDLLASRPEVDPQRIGITGISLGGIVAATASAGEPRLHRVFLLLAGGDLLAIIHHARETSQLSQMLRRMPADERAELEAKLTAVDPLPLAEKLEARAKAGRVMMINAAEDEVIPRRCTEKLARALGIQDQVIWLDGLGHYTAMAELPRALRMLGEFFGQDMPEGVAFAPAATRQSTPLQLLVGLLGQAAALMTVDPAERHCHFADLEIVATPEGEDTIHARLRVIRGSGHKFKIEADVPSVKQLGSVAVGQGTFPWMTAGGKAVFEGTQNPAEKLRDPLELADPDQAVKLRMAAGAATGLTLAPDLLSRWITVEDDSAEDGRRAIRITAKDKGGGTARLVFRADGVTPELARFEFSGVTGKVTFHGWQTGTVAHPALFEPPAEVPRKAVEQHDVYRMMAAMFNFAMESVQ